MFMRRDDVDADCICGSPWAAGESLRRLPNTLRRRFQPAGRDRDFIMSRLLKNDALVNSTGTRIGTLPRSVEVMESCPLFP
jgi:hypothetical protein